MYKKNKEKLQLWKLELIIIIILMCIFSLWQYNSMKPKKYSFNINENITILPKSFIEVSNLNKNTKQILCAINYNNLPDKEYNNYVCGPGVGKKINFSIILYQNNKYYKIPTLEKNQDFQNVYLVGCIKNKYLIQDYKIFLYDIDNKKTYEYVGEENEK